MIHGVMQKEDAVRDLALQSPQERVNAVRPFWENLPQEERVKLLVVAVTDLRARAKQLSEKARAQAGQCVLVLVWCLVVGSPSVFVICHMAWCAMPTKSKQVTAATATVSGGRWVGCSFEACMHACQ